MVAAAKKSKPTGRELMILWDDYMAKRKRWLGSYPRRAGALDNPLTDGYLVETDRAYDAVYVAAKRAAGIKRHTKPFSIDLPDERVLVGVPNEDGEPSDSWQYLWCVHPDQAIRLEE
jgi:hypothetical protein